MREVSTIARDWRKTEDGAADWVDAGPPIYDPDLHLALVEVVMRLPDEDFEKLDEARPLILFQQESRVMRLAFHTPLAEVQGGVAGAHQWFVLLRSDIAQQPHKEIVGEVAHEFGHVILGHDMAAGFHEPTGEEEFETCAWAIKAGFVEETLAMLHRPEKQEFLDDDCAWGVCMRRLPELEELATKGGQLDD